MSASRTGHTKILFPGVFSLEEMSEEADDDVVYSVGMNRQDDGGRLPALTPNLSYGRPGTDAAGDIGVRVPLHPSR